jgi:Zn-dependent protease
LSSFAKWLGQLQFDGVWQTALLVIASVFAITVHETCHGYVAYRLGDPTAKNMGRLTLNPFKHIDLVGLVMMAVCHFGWAKPVPIDMRRFKNPKSGMALTALAGPVSNVLLAYLGVLLGSVSLYFYDKNGSEAAYVFVVFFYYLELISAGLAVFNVFPIPPLDGSKVFFAVLSDDSYYKLMRYERYGMLLLVILLLTNVLDTPLLFLRDGLTKGLEAAGSWPYLLLANLNA